MAASLDMFGAGGEGLGGLFVGNELAMQRDIREQEMANRQAEMARSQALTRGNELSNQYEEAIMGDKIAAFKSEAGRKKEADDLDKFNRQGEQFGRLGQMLSGIPAAARGAALRQMAAQGGIAEDNPMLQHMMGADPEALPDMMMAFSKGFYEQGDKARAEKMKREEMAALERQKAAARSEEKEADRALRRDIADQGFALRRDLAAMSQAGQDRRASARSAGKSGGGGKDPMAGLTRDKLMAALEYKQASEGLTPGEEFALENLKRQELARTTARSTGVEEQVMGAKSPEQRIEDSLARQRKGEAPAPAKSASTDIAAAVKKAGQQYEPDKYEYRITADGRVQKRAK